MVVQGVDRQADDLHVPPVELRLQARDLAQLGGADRGEVLRMAEQHAPAIAEPLVEVHRALAGVLLEIGGDLAELDVHVPLLGEWRRKAPPRI